VFVLVLMAGFDEKAEFDHKLEKEWAMPIQIMG
jgi:hypothetical protein